MGMHGDSSQSVGKEKGLKDWRLNGITRLAQGMKANGYLLSAAASVNVIVARHSISGTLEIVNFAIFSNKSVCDHQMPNDREGGCAFLSLDW